MDYENKRRVDPSAFMQTGQRGAFQGHSDPLLLQAEYLVLANVGDGFSIRKDCNGDYLDCWQMF